jgi:hypothetical protein
MGYNSGSGTPNATSRKVMAIAPISASTTQTSTGIDVRGFGWLEVDLLVGVMTATGTIDLKLQGSDTLGGTYADITGAVMAQRVAATDGAKIYHGQLNLANRPKNTSSVDCNFIRVVCANATAASVVAVECILSNPDRTERVQAVQLGSSPAATPLTASDSLFSI